LKNRCLLSELKKITLIIFDDALNAKEKFFVDVCYKPDAYITEQTFLNDVSFGEIRATSENVTFSNITAPAGFSINPDGTVNVPANALPGDYIFTYTLCPSGSTTGCVNDIIVSFTIYNTVRANPDVFYFDKFGVFVNSSHDDPSSFNVISNDGYVSDCGFSAPNSFLPPEINSTITTISNVVYEFPTGNHFILNEATGVITCFSNIGLLPGYYSLEYSICDYQYPTVCSRTNVLIYVIDAVARTNNQIKETEVIKNISIYPNPVSQSLTIQLPITIEIQKATIYNSLGQLIKTEDKKEINVSDLSKGSYLIKIDTDKGSTTKVFIVQ
jgi:hypothetical protein